MGRLDPVYARIVDVPRKAQVDKRVFALGFVLIPIALVLGASGVLFLTLLGMWIGVGGLAIGATLLLLLIWWIWATTRGML